MRWEPQRPRWNQTQPLDQDTVPLRYDTKPDDAGVELLDSKCDGNKEIQEQPQTNWRRRVGRILREKRLLIILLLCLVVPVVVVVQNDMESKEPSIPAFYFVGDSITELGSTPDTGGWVTLMQDQYAPSTDMINRGLSGWNTRSVRL